MSMEDENRKKKIPKSDPPPSPVDGLYSETFKLSSGMDVTVREMTTAEEGRLLKPKGVKDGSALNGIIQACTLTPEGLDTMKLCQGDRQVLVVAVRRLTYGNLYTYKVPCPNSGCKKIFPFEIDLAGMEQHDLMDVPDHMHEFTLPRKGDVLTFQLITGHEEVRYSKRRNRSRKS